MLSKKIRTIVVFGCIAAIFAAVGYWNISPERFLDRPATQIEERSTGTRPTRIPCSTCPTAKCNMR